MINELLPPSRTVCDHAAFTSSELARLNSRNPLVRIANGKQFEVLSKEAVRNGGNAL